MRRFAANLTGLGVSRGDRVVLFVPVVPEAVVAFLACAMIGAISVPAFTGYGAEALAARLRDSGAVALVTADATTRRGKLVPLTQTADEALAAVPSATPSSCAISAPMSRCGPDATFPATAGAVRSTISAPTTCWSQAEGGSCAITGLPGQPAKPGIPIADVGTALYAYSSVLAALYERERTGRGAVIPVAMLDVVAR